MKLINVKVITATSLLLTLFSCATERPVYQGAEYYKNLEIPPDLTEPDTGNQLRVPKASDEALQRFRDNHKLETVVTPKFDGVRMVNYAGNSWVEIDNDAEHVWMRLLEFWQTEGIELAEKRPLLGYMETKWVERLQEETGFFRSIFQGIEPDQKDKFRVRVERFDRDQKTRLYIAHSRIERVVHGDDDSEYIWQSLPSDLEAERELLSRMVLFAGLTDEQSLELLENYRPYSSMVKLDRRNAIALTMTGSMDFVWRRAMRALDRMRMQDIKEDKQSSTIYFTVKEISDEDLHVDEGHDELAKSSWITQLFANLDDEDLASNISRHYRLEFSSVDGRIQIEVKDASDSQTTDGDGNVSSTALAEQLRNALAENLE
ncbi:MAG: outer membrane protein assembly factor BamC [Gammaproteobacteria bacterium]